MYIIIAIHKLTYNKVSHKSVKKNYIIKKFKSSQRFAKTKTIFEQI